MGRTDTWRSWHEEARSAGRALPPYPIESPLRSSPTARSFVTVKATAAGAAGTRSPPRARAAATGAPALTSAASPPSPPPGAAEILVEALDVSLRDYTEGGDPGISQRISSVYEVRSLGRRDGRHPSFRWPVGRSASPSSPDQGLITGDIYQNGCSPSLLREDDRAPRPLSLPEESLTSKRELGGGMDVLGHVERNSRHRHLRHL